MRDVVVDADSLGKHDHDRKVQHGSALVHKRLDADPPPKDSEIMPKSDTIDKPKTHDRPIKDLRNDLKARNLSTEGNVQVMRERCNEANPPISAKEKHGKIIKGYVGLQLGLMGVLLRRGHVGPATEKLPADSEARNIARSMPDFVDEPSEIEMTMKSLGVEILFTPKGHCELARRGVECV